MLYTVVQVSQLPLHIFTVYLFPNAVVGSHKYSLNCEVLAWVLKMAETLHGPILITGDMNISWRAFEALRDLTARGWADMHELAHHRFGASLDPTCQGATRHTFQFGNQDFSRFLAGMSVAHAVLVGQYDFPCSNLQVWKWLLPRTFDDIEIDQHKAKSADVPTEVLSAVQDILHNRMLLSLSNSGRNVLKSH